MAENKTRKTGASVDEFLAAIQNRRRREDGLKVLEMMREITGLEPDMWGPSIIGFGDYHYKYESGREGDMFLTGFSPRKQNLTLYIIDGREGHQQLMDRLGKHRTSTACLYINKLADVDAQVLRQLIVISFESASAAR